MNSDHVVKLTACLILVVGNGILDHFGAPVGIFITPVIIMITTGLVAANQGKWNPLQQSFLSVLFIVINDLGIKLYGAGMHDQVGLAWNMFLFIGLVPAFIVLLVSIINHKNTTPVFKAVGILMFPALMAVYLYFFKDAGLGRYY